MKSTKPSPPYSILGRYYDQLTHEAAGMNQHARKKILGSILAKVKTVCDLGCGTGTTAIHLARSGKRVYAVDASPVQCGQAKKKIKDAKVPVRVICSDMRKLSLPEPVDLILCEFNPLNHLADKRDLKPVLQKIYQSLLPRGWFYFDLNMKQTYLKYYPATRWEEHDDFSLLTRGGVDEERETAWLDLDWFIPKGNAWQRFRERIEDTWWSNAEIQSALRNAGFANIRTWDGALIRPKKMKPRPGYDRYYLAQKRQKSG
ncbi:MAG: class I SAM-dependent methyltransferase [Planctomycetota bacterium]